MCECAQYRGSALYSEVCSSLTSCVSVHNIEAVYSEVCSSLTSCVSVHNIEAVYCTVRCVAALHHV